MMEILVGILFGLAILGAVGATSCFLQMLQQQKRDWAHDRHLGLRSADLEWLRSVGGKPLHIVFAEQRLEELGDLSCPIHGKEACKSGKSYYLHLLRKFKKEITK